MLNDEVEERGLGDGFYYESGLISSLSLASTLNSISMDTTAIESIIGTILEQLSLPFSGVTISQDEDMTRVEIASPQASKIIGWHGETLNSIQHLVKSIIRSQQNLERSPFIVIDVDGYRKDQEEKACASAKQKADFVRRTGNRVTLPPMNPYFRRVVHLYIANHPDLQDIATESAGEGDYRQIVMRLKDEKSNTSDGEELSPILEDSGDDLGNLDI